ncbi:MAG: hypothetical protein ACJ76H_02555 [Bacteriovoracaceae bacterium]
MKFLSLLILLMAPCAFAAGPISGVEGPFVNVHDGKLVVTLKMLDATHPTGLSFGVTEEKKSIVDYRPNLEEGGMVLELQLDIDDLKSVDTSEGKETKLADGRNIPGVPGGQVKNSVRKDHQDFSTFHSPKSFGIAFPMAFSHTRDGHHWLNWKGKNIGMISVVNASADKKAYGMIFLRYSALKKNRELMARLKKKYF